MIQSEGGLSAPQRHPIAWQEEAFYQLDAFHKECARVFDVCHGCRRCVNLCHSFPTLFDLIDHSSDLEVSGVDPADYHKVAQQCYLCDLCFMTKCPYVPPHEWAIDFPALMLRAKAIAFRRRQLSQRHKQLAEVDRNGSLGGIPVINQVANKVMDYSWARRMLDVHPHAVLPKYQRRAVTKKMYEHASKQGDTVYAGSTTSGKIAIFPGCYSNYHDAQLVEDIIQVLEYNEVPVELIANQRCCGMPKLELGDIASIDRHKQDHIDAFMHAIDRGCDIVAPVPSCVLLFRGMWPLLYPDDAEIKRISSRIYDPSEYLMRRHSDGLLNTNFPNRLGKVVYHLACHTRVQNFGYKTRELLSLVPGTKLSMIERCSGHDGTYGVKRETYPHARRIGGPPAQQLKRAKADYFTSDCVLAGQHIAELAESGLGFNHPFALLKYAYGI